MANFSEPNRFMPERWLDRNQNIMSVASGGPGASLVLPFGIGRRTCPGKKYTEMQLSVVVAKVQLKTILIITKYKTLLFLVNTSL